jgi:hypothetical protein
MPVIFMQTVDFFFKRRVIANAFADIFIEYIVREAEVFFVG